MPNGDPRDGFFFPTLTLMMDSYILVFRFQSAFRPADWKYQSQPETWNRLSTDVGVNVPIELPVKFQNSSVLKQIQVILIYGKCSKISKTFRFQCSNTMLVFRAGIYKMIVRIANREDPD